MSMHSAIVLGAGSWGTALASALAERGLHVQFWGREPSLMANIERTRRNERYLPSLQLPDNVVATHDLKALKPADLLVFVVPSKGIADVASAVAAAGLGFDLPTVLSCTKGIELHSARRMSEILGDALPGCPIAALSGPNHAEEVAQRQATAAVVAAKDEAIAKRVQDCFRLPWFRCYTTTDIIGVEWAGAMKNPYAIAAGIAAGLNLGDNASAALVTRALAEMVRLGVARGGRSETFFGLSGVGDLVATCYSKHSRNHRLGLALASGQSLADATASSSMIAEGVPNTLSLRECAQATGVRTPLLDAIYDVLYQGKAPVHALRELLGREPRGEAE
jgi:glycerol-3-phosphate dehydrogenase (NAD(P)+)